MREVKSKNTKSTELKMIKLFKEYYITGWHTTYPLMGHPDFVFSKKRIAIFVNGSFWHGHDCRNVTPKENVKFWDAKQEYNKRHDAKMTEKLEKKDRLVIRILECELRHTNNHLILKLKEVL